MHVLMLPWLICIPCGVVWRLWFRKRSQVFARFFHFWHVELFGNIKVYNRYIPVSRCGLWLMRPYKTCWSGDAKRREAQSNVDLHAGSHCAARAQLERVAFLACHARWYGKGWPVNIAGSARSLACSVTSRQTRPCPSIKKIFGSHVTRRKINSFRALLQGMLEDTAKYQCWENDIQALLLDLDKIDVSF